jgi:hypothetical protein
MRYANALLTLTALAVTGCAEGPRAPAVLQRLRVMPQDTVRLVRNRSGVEVAVRAGGFGSALAVDSSRERFYLLTDRGPNVDGPLPDSKIFPIPGYTPRIGVFRITGDALVREQVIELTRADGSRVSGLPTPAGPGATGETALALDGSVIAAREGGMDAEGLAVLPDGSFWVADEYGPSLVHFDRDGRETERMRAGGERGLPAVLTRRRPNYGIEALAAAPSGGLIAVMQSPLDNPREAGRRSRAVRLLVIDASGSSRQVVYELDDPAYMVSAATAASADELLVVERDDLFPGDADRPSRQKRVYRVSLSGATDVSDPGDAAAGRLWSGKTLESLTDAERRAAGIMPVRKEAAVDLLALGYPHDKPEGIAMLGDDRIAVSNDDDFGVVDGEGGIAPKRLPATGTVDQNEVWIIRLR